MICLPLSGMSGEVCDQEGSEEQTDDKEGKTFCFGPSPAVGATRGCTAEESLSYKIESTPISLGLFKTIRGTIQTYAYSSKF